MSVLADDLQSEREPRLKWSRWKGVAILLAVMAAFAIPTEHIIQLRRDQTVEQARSDATHDLSLLRARLEGELYSTIYLARGLVAWIGTGAEVDDRLFERFAYEMVYSRHHIRHIALAPDNVLKYLYPLEGSEAALGVDYADLPDQWPTVRDTIEARVTTVAGPVELVQGGSALVARTPIFVAEEIHLDTSIDRTRAQSVMEAARAGGDYWGMLAIVIDVSELLDSAGLPDVATRKRLAVRGVDGRGARGDVFFGEETLFTEDAVRMDVALPHGSWQIAMSPDDVDTLIPPWWNSAIRISGYGIALGMALMLLLLLREKDRNKVLAEQDPLTKLPNTRVLRRKLARLRKDNEGGGGGFAVVLVDLDRFKQINDVHGHQAGDAVLREVALRLAAAVRPTDTVARLGGDEFIAVLTDVSEHDQLDERVGRLERELSKPVRHDGLELEVVVSLGAAVCEGEESDLDEVMRIADARMYARKRARYSGKHEAAR